MKTSFLSWLGIALILQTGLLHLYAAPNEVVDAPFWGALFALNFIATLVAAFGLWRRQRWGWVLGALIAGGSLIGYFLSRTSGMPGMEVEAWGDPAGSASLVVEGAFLVVALLAATWGQVVVPPATLDGETTQPALWVRALFPIGALLLIALITGYTVQAGATWPSTGSGVAAPQVVTLSAQELEDQYGLRVNLLAATAMNSVVDLRLKILDVNKARPLLEDPARMPALLIGDQAIPKTVIPTFDEICGPDGTLVFNRQNPRALIMPAHMGHMDKKIKQGGMYIMFYPNPQNLVKSGTPISLFFGDIRLGPFSVQ